MVKKASEVRQELRAEMAGGKGSAQLTHLLELEELQGKGRLFSKITLAPGHSVGEHQHRGDFEVYYILSGKGIVNDNGTFKEVYPGDVILTKEGEFHSIENIGETDLELIALILYI